MSNIDERMAKFSTSQAVAFGEGVDKAGIAKRAMGVVCGALLAAGLTLSIGVTLPSTAHAEEVSYKSSADLSRAHDRQAIVDARAMQAGGVEPCFAGALHLKTGESHFYVKAIACAVGEAPVLGQDVNTVKATLGIPQEMPIDLSEASVESLSTAWDFVDGANKRNFR